MREILFRAKRKDNGEWIEGFTLFKPDQHLYMFKTAWGEITYDLQYNITAIIGRKEPFFVEVIPETIGQYTGLTDKNGVKIFEGDILKGWRNSLYVVKFGYFIDDAIAFILEPDELEEIEPVLGWYCQEVRTNQKFGFYEDMSHLEIISNIYDNSELLKGELK